eukprot:TRINITY_DN18970_c0_g1_i1.p1 TRINITY_DN18970_c0_g1~~TRINITY_DN18970_c0_g1_i1.p1  ORF type:complete len:182 (-),score=11.42 TRINITY_DN18970_c0_g1_i1:96-641(-)
MKMQHSVTLIDGDSEFLYQVGESTVYTEIIADYPDDTADIFETDLVNVWLCTFSPEDAPVIANIDGAKLQEGETGAVGCFSPSRDADDYYFHIYQENGSGDLGKTSDGLEAFNLADSGSNDRVQFSFYCSSSNSERYSLCSRSNRVDVAVRNRMKKKIASNKKKTSKCNESFWRYDQDNKQ